MTPVLALLLIILTGCVLYFIALGVSFVVRERREHCQRLDGIRADVEAFLAAEVRAGDPDV